MLHEREDYEEPSGPTTRLIAIAGGGLIAIMFFALIAVLVLNNNDGNDPPAAGATGTETQSAGGGTVISRRLEDAVGDGLSRYTLSLCDGADDNARDADGHAGARSDAVADLHSGH